MLILPLTQSCSAKKQLWSSPVYKPFITHPEFGSSQADRCLDIKLQFPQWKKKKFYKQEQHTWERNPHAGIRHERNSKKLKYSPISNSISDISLRQSGAAWPPPKANMAKVKLPLGSCLNKSRAQEWGWALATAPEPAAGTGFTGNCNCSSEMFQTPDWEAQLVPVLQGSLREQLDSALSPAYRSGLFSISYKIHNPCQNLIGSLSQSQSVLTCETEWEKRFSYFRIFHTLL